MVIDNPVYLCWMCGKRVDVETSKTDEQGKAVHEACYAARLTLERTLEWPLTFPRKTNERYYCLPTVYGFQFADLSPVRPQLYA